MSRDNFRYSIALWNRIRRFQQDNQLSKNFLTLYASSLLVDLGLCLYFFMFNLFLVEHHFSERSIGFISAALTVGNIAGTAPAGYLSRRFGLRTMLLSFVVFTPACLGLRAVLLSLSWQLILAFLSGAGMSIWFVCFSPALAKLTTQKNRTLSFGLFFATGISSGALAGVIGGYFPSFTHRFRGRDFHLDGVTAALLFACAIVSLAGFMIIRLRFQQEPVRAKTGWPINGFLVRFLIAISAWNFSMGFFNPFTNVFLSRQLGLSVAHIGTVYTASQVIQVVAVLLAPFLYRRIGLIVGIALTQMMTGAVLLGLSRASGARTAVAVYLLLTALQWMSGPGIYSLLMNRTPEEDRSHASAMQNFVNLAAQAAAAALAGRVIQQYGYAGPLEANAGLAVVAAFLIYLLLKEHGQCDATQLSIAESSHLAH